MLPYKAQSVNPQAYTAYAEASLQSLLKFDLGFSYQVCLDFFFPTLLYVFQSFCGQLPSSFSFYISLPSDFPQPFLLQFVLFVILGVFIP